MATLDFGLMLRHNDPSFSIAELIAYNRSCIEALSSGFTTLWLEDHMQAGATDALESLTTLSYLAAAYPRFYIGNLVLSQSYRNPALLAKMFANLHALTGGRAILGTGAGWKEDEYRAYGYPFSDGPTRLRQLRDAVQILLAMWTQPEAVFEGHYHQVHGAINQPKGVQKPHIPLLIGGGGEQVTLKLVAQYGDACNIGHLDNAGLERKFAILKQHCTDLGRNYQDIRRTVLFNCAIADTDEAAMAKSTHFARNIPSGRLREQSLIGTPDTIRRRLAEIEQAGAQEVIVFMPDSAQLDVVRLFAKECITR